MEHHTFSYRCGNGILGYILVERSEILRDQFDQVKIIGRHLDFIAKPSQGDQDTFPPELQIKGAEGNLRINQNDLLEPVAIYVKSHFQKHKRVLVYRRGMRNIFCIDDENVMENFPDSINPFFNIPSLGFGQPNRQLSLYYEFCFFRFNFANEIYRSLRSISKGDEVKKVFGISSTVADFFFR